MEFSSGNAWTTSATPLQTVHHVFDYVDALLQRLPDHFKNKTEKLRRLLRKMKEVVVRFVRDSIDLLDICYIYTYIHNQKTKEMGDKRT